MHHQDGPARKYPHSLLYSPGLLGRLDDAKVFLSEDQEAAEEVASFIRYCAQRGKEERHEPAPARRLLMELLQAFNDASPEPLAAFLAAAPALAQQAPLWPPFRRTSSPLKLMTCDEAKNEPSLHALLEDRWGRTWELKLETSGDQVTQLTVLPTWRPANLLPQRSAWSVVERQLKARLAQGIAKGWYSGALQVSQNGKPRFNTAYGLADRDAQVPNALETRFRIGSMNKMLTGVAILQLAEAGKLDLDDPVGRHLPDYPNRRFADQVTVRHLLNHTGGAGDFFGAEFDAHRLEMREPADFIARLGHRDPEFAPGSRHTYANYGFIVLGRIVETVSDATYDEYIADHILGTAGMTDTGALPEGVPVERRARGYMDSADGPIGNDHTLPYRGTPAGGGYSTVGDLVRFGDSLLSGRLLSVPSLALTGAGGVEVAPGISYGAGFVEMRRGGVRWFGHTGGAPGMNGSLQIFPDSGYVVAGLANGDPPQAESLVDFIVLRLPER